MDSMDFSAEKLNSISEDQEVEEVSKYSARYIILKWQSLEFNGLNEVIVSGSAHISKRQHSTWGHRTREWDHVYHRCMHSLVSTSWQVAHRNVTVSIGSSIFLFVCICVAMEWILEHMDNFGGLRISLFLFRAVLIFVFFPASSHVQGS